MYTTKSMMQISNKQMIKNNADMEAKLSQMFHIRYKKRRDRKVEKNIYIIDNEQLNT